MSIVLGAAPIAGHAQAQPASRPPLGALQGPNLSTQAHVLDNDQSVVSLKLQYTGEEAENAVGGLRNGWTYMNNVLAQLHVDAGRAFGWQGGSFSFEGFYENQDSLDTQFVGAVQDPSLIDTSGVAVARVYQAYYKQDLGHTNILVGIYDPETEFGITKAMDIFLNGAYNWTTTLDQSGVNGPSTYPSTALGARIRQKIGSHWRVQAAVLDGVPNSAKNPRATSVNFNKANGAMFIAEVDYVPTRTTKFLAGLWDYTGSFVDLNPPAIGTMPHNVYGSRGGYVGGDTRLYAITASRGLDAFANIGIATAETQQVDASLNLGLSYTGMLDDRPYDKMGVAVGIAQAGNAYRRMQIAAGEPVGHYETNFEATYRAPVTNWLTIQPDVQYWVHPDMAPRLKNDLLFLVHFEIGHVFNF